MRRLIGSYLAFAATVFWLAGGCPLESTSTTTGVPASSSGSDSGVSTGSSSTGRTSVGLQSSGSTDSGSSATAATGTGQSQVAVSGTVSTTTATSDGLTVTYPGCQQPQEVDYWRSEILRLVNEKRSAAGIGTVTRNRTLEDQATQYACELIHDDFFAHVDPITGSTLRDRADDFGYDYWIIGENLAAGQRSPVEAITAWINSPCHRENILNPAFTELGVGVRVGGDYGVYWVQEFGRPTSLSPYPGPAYEDPECTHAE